MKAIVAIGHAGSVALIVGPDNNRIVIVDRPQCACPTGRSISRLIEEIAHVLGQPNGAEEIGLLAKRLGMADPGPDLDPTQPPASA